MKRKMGWGGGGGKKEKKGGGGEKKRKKGFFFFFSVCLILYCLQIRSRLGASAASALRHKKNTPYIKRYKDISENIVKRLIHRFSQG